MIVITMRGFLNDKRNKRSQLAIDRRAQEAAAREDLLFLLASQVHDGEFSAAALEEAARDTLEYHEHQPAAWYALASLRLREGLIGEGCDDLEWMLADSRYVVTHHTPHLGVYGLALLVRVREQLEEGHESCISALEEYTRQHAWADPFGRQYLATLRGHVEEGFHPRQTFKYPPRHGHRL